MERFESSTSAYVLGIKAWIEGAPGGTRTRKPPLFGGATSPKTPEYQCFKAVRVRLDVPRYRSIVGKMWAQASDSITSASLRVEGMSAVQRPPRLIEKGGEGVYCLCVAKGRTSLISQKRTVITVHVVDCVTNADGNFGEFRERV